MKIGEIYEVKFLREKDMRSLTRFDRGPMRNIFVVVGEHPTFGFLGHQLWKDGYIGVPRAVFSLPDIKVIPVVKVDICPECGLEKKIPIYKDYLCEDCRKLP